MTSEEPKSKRRRFLTVPFRQRLALARAIAEIAGIDSDQVDVQRAVRKLKQGWREGVALEDLPVPPPNTAARLAFAEALDTEANDGLVRTANIRLLAEIEGEVGKAALLKVNVNLRPEQQLPDEELDYLLNKAKTYPTPLLEGAKEGEPIDVTPSPAPEVVPVASPKRDGQPEQGAAKDAVKGPGAA